MSSDDEVDKLLKSRMYSRRGPDGEEIVGMDLGLQGRTIGRDRRCQNCQFFDVEGLFESHFSACMARSARELRESGATEEEARLHLAKMKAGLFDRRPLVGYCLRRDVRTDKNATDDFSHAHHLCSTWSGAYGQTFESPVDKLDDEILDRLGDKQPDGKEDTTDRKTDRKTD